MDKSNLVIFCRQIRSRSEENRRAIENLFDNSLYANIVSILRQELDSMIRVIYLLSIDDIDYRNDLIKKSVNGQMWCSKTGQRITDREMVELSSKLHGWERNVYKFGCAFIHLSSYHDYLARDPMKAISSKERKEIVLYLRSYHNGPSNDDPNFDETAEFFPKVFKKIRDNLEFYTCKLENNEKYVLHSN